MCSMHLALASIAMLAAGHAGRHMLHLFIHLGLIGLLLVSVVDSSFIPLPIPGVTDIMVILFAAHGENPVLIVLAATIGSALGGLFSHAVGQAGGMAFLEKHVPKKLLKGATTWVEKHTLVSIAVPAILPPPVPLAPFVLAAGVVKVSRRKFMIAFTASRCLRHAIACWLGIRYGAAVLGLWNHFSERWAVTILVVFWGVIVLFTGIGIWKLIQASRSVGLRGGQRGAAQPHSA